MYANGTAFNCHQIARYLTEQTGMRVDHITVRTWVDDEYREYRNERRRELRRLRNQHRAITATPILDRMLELRGAGVSLKSIAAIMRLDEGIVLNADQVRYYLRVRHEPFRRKRRSGKGGR
jgi:hypothetical protein